MSDHDDKCEGVDCCCDCRYFMERGEKDIARLRAELKTADDCNDVLKSEVAALKKAVLAKCPGPGAILVFDGPIPRIRFDEACHNHLILSRVEFSNQVAALKAYIERLERAIRRAVPYMGGMPIIIEDALAAKPEQEGK